MYVTRKSRRALARIHAAIQGVRGYAYNAGEDAGGGAGGGDKDAAKEKQADKGKQAEGLRQRRVDQTRLDDDDADKVTLTKAERDQLIADAKADAKREADDKARKAKAEADAEDAKKRGEWEAVAATEKTKREEAEAGRARAERNLALRDYLAEHKPELAKGAAVIAKLVDADETDTDKAVKAAVAEYEKSLPEKPKGSAGLDPSPRTANRQTKSAFANRTEAKDPTQLPNGNRILPASSRW